VAEEATLAFQLQRDTWQGRDDVSLLVRHVEPSDTMQG
jgi:hypothetical protein